MGGWYLASQNRSPEKLMSVFEVASIGAGRWIRRSHGDPT